MDHKTIGGWEKHMGILCFGGFYIFILEIIGICNFRFTLFKFYSCFIMIEIIFYFHFIK